jgi:uncharacterized protein YutE (UPF0331/DUF86 family)
MTMGMDNIIRYDVERIGTIIFDIQRYIQDLDDLKICRIQELGDKRNFYAASMILFSLLNRVFDLGSEVAIAHNLGIPSTYREIFVLMRKNELIENDLAHRMIGMVTCRNLLSHEYHGITEEKLFSLIHQIATIREFVDAMQKKIQDKK